MFRAKSETKRQFRELLVYPADKDILAIKGEQRTSLLGLDDTEMQKYIVLYTKNGGNPFLNNVTASKPRTSILDSLASRFSIFKRAKTPATLSVEEMDIKELDETLNSILTISGVSGVTKMNFMRGTTATKIQIIQQYEANRTSQLKTFVNNRTSSRNSTATPITSRKSSRKSSLSVNPPLHASSHDSTQHLRHSPSWYAMEIADSNASMKGLGRTLSSFRHSLSLQSDLFIQHFIETKFMTSSGAWSITGLDALDLALLRIKKHESGGRDFHGNRNRNKALPNVPRNQHAWYADAILEDELRLEIVHCLHWIMQRDFGMGAVLESNLLKTVIGCFGLPSSDVIQRLMVDQRLRGAYLSLRTFLADLLGPICLLDEQGRQLIIKQLEHLASIQGEPRIFYSIVRSIANPFELELGSDKSPGEYSELQYLAEGDDVWAYRTSIMLFLNGIVSSGETTQERKYLRKILESSGLKSIINQLAEAFPSEPFEAQIEAYHEDILHDMVETEATHRREDESRDICDQFDKFLEKLRSEKNQDSPLCTASHSIINIIELVNSIQQQPAIEDDSQTLLRVLEDTTRTFNECYFPSSDEAIDKSKILGMQLVSTIQESLGLQKEERQDLTILEIANELERANQRNAELSLLILKNQKELEFMRASNNRSPPVLNIPSLPLSRAAADSRVIRSGKLSASSSNLPQIPYIDVNKDTTDLDSFYQDILMMDERKKSILYNTPNTASSTDSILSYRSHHQSAGELSSPQATQEELKRRGVLPQGSAMGGLWTEIIRLEDLCSELSLQNESLRLASKKDGVELLKSLSRGDLTRKRPSRHNITVPSSVDIPLPIDIKPTADEGSPIFSPHDIPPPPPQPFNDSQHSLSGIPPPPPGPASHTVIPSFPLAPSVSFLKSGKPMHPLQWKKIRFPSKNSIWNDLAQTAQEKVTLEEKELLELFEKINIKAEIEPGRRGSSVIIERISLVDHKKGQNIEIMLKGLRMSNEGIKMAVLEMNDEGLSLERLRQMETFSPTSTEIDALNSYDGALDALCQPSRYLICMLDIPRLIPRLKAMVFRRRFLEEVRELENDVATVLAAIDQVIASQLLLDVLSHILVLGNYLNGSSFRGNASGFKIESLLSLKDTHSNSKKKAPTLLHYISRSIAKSGLKAAALAEELSLSEVVSSQINITFLLEGISVLSSGLADIQNEFEAFVKADSFTNGDRFQETVKTFLDDSSPRLETLLQRSKEVVEKLNVLWDKFGEDANENNSAPQVFFQNISGFIRMLMKVERENSIIDNKGKKQVVSKQPLKEIATPLNKLIFPRASSLQSDIESELNNNSGFASSQNHASQSLEEAPLQTFMAILPAATDGIARLKPVDGFAPFSKRMTVRTEYLASYHAKNHDESISKAENPSPSDVNEPSIGDVIEVEGPVDDSTGEALYHSAGSFELTRILMAQGALKDARNTIRRVKKKSKV